MVVLKDYTFPAHLEIGESYFLTSRILGEYRAEFALVRPEYGPTVQVSVFRKHNIGASEYYALVSIAEYRFAFNSYLYWDKHANQLPSSVIAKCIGYATEIANEYANWRIHRPR